jgi:hypothetical protein
MGEQGHGTRQHTISIGAVFWTLRRLQKELSENSDDQPHGRVELEEEDAAATAVDALLAEFCDNAVPVAQRAAAERELLALRKRFRTEPVASRFLVALRQKMADEH